MKLLEDFIIRVMGSLTKIDYPYPKVIKLRSLVQNLYPSMN
jgi:hypothetical protein